MDEMDETIKQLTDENLTLKSQYTCLTLENQELASKNAQLEQRLHELEAQLSAHTAPERKFEIDSDEAVERLIGCDIIRNKNGSAASASPLPKGEPIKSQSMGRPLASGEPMKPRRGHGPSTDSAALWKIIALCLLYRTFSKISMPADLKSLPRACSQMSQRTLKALLQQAAAQLPKLKAPQSQCLDQWWGPKQKNWNPAKISMKA